MKLRRYRLIAVAALSVTMILLGTPEPTAAAEDHYITQKEAVVCVKRFGPGPCAAAKDASNWALNVTVWKFRHQGHNNMADAFRHCAWMGAVATRVGYTKALSIGFLHEEYTPNPQAEYLMDINNNAMGAKIGKDAVAKRLRDTWGYVIQQCETKARAKKLYGMNGKLGNYSK